MQEKNIYFECMVFGKLLETRSVSDFGNFQIDYQLSISNLKTQKNAPKSELVFFFPPLPPLLPSHSSLPFFFLSFFSAGNQAHYLTNAEQVRTSELTPSHRSESFEHHISAPKVSDSGAFQIPDLGLRDAQPVHNHFKRK